MSEYILGGVIAAQFGVIAFLMHQMQKLVDKVMSRNYGEYVQGQVMTSPAPTAKIDMDDPPEDLNIMKDFMG